MTAAGPAPTAAQPALTAVDRRLREHQAGRRALRRVLVQLADPADPATLPLPHPRFSISHCDGVAVAVGAVDPAATGVGVDLERIRPVPAGVARLFLTDREQSWWAVATGTAAADTLLRLWTVKEAVFKADVGNAGKLLADYELALPAGWAGSASHGPARFAYRSFRLSGFLLSLAVHEEDPT